VTSRGTQFGSATVSGSRASVVVIVGRGLSQACLDRQRLQHFGNRIGADAVDVRGRDTRLQSALQR